MEPPPKGASDSSWSEGSTLRRGGENALHVPPSTASLEHLNLAGKASGDAREPDEKAETVIRRQEGGSSVKASVRKSPATPVEVAGVLLGSRLSHFHLEELIGGGGMGAVFRARDERLDRTVAIKVIPFVGDDPEMQRRFRNEAQSAARLDHPNIARVFDVGMFEGWRYIVFEHIEGPISATWSPAMVC
jgi:eukaryotic-like serine/threonine-protein kinase